MDILLPSDSPILGQAACLKLLSLLYEANTLYIFQLKHVTNTQSSEKSHNAPVRYILY